jgi:hypothetical protein
MRAPLPRRRVVATPGALKLLRKSGGHPFDLLARHASGDWGDLCTFDCRQNEIALRDGYRVFSAYDILWLGTQGGMPRWRMALPHGIALLVAAQPTGSR